MKKVDLIIDVSDESVVKDMTQINEVTLHKEETAKKNLSNKKL
jgi:hypothetical protein